MSDFDGRIPETPAVVPLVPAPAETLAQVHHRLDAAGDSVEPIRRATRDPDELALAGAIVLIAQAVRDLAALYADHYHRGLASGATTHPEHGTPPRGIH